MSDLLLSLHLDDIRYFLLSGDPPVIVQFLVINTMLMIFMIIRRTRRKQLAQRHVAHALQWILISANLLVFCENSWLPFLRLQTESIVTHVRDATISY